MKQKIKLGRKMLSFLLMLAMVVGLMPGMSLTAYAADVPYANLKDTINVINFDGKEWYLIDYDGDSTVTLLSKECVGASVFNPNEPDDNTYSGSTVENFVNSWYTRNISPDAQAVVSGSGMFLLTEEQAGNLSTDVLKCSRASGAYDNHWWLCSKGTTNSSAAMVNGESGKVSGYSGNVWIAYGVRPALKLDLSKVMFGSDTNTFTVKIKVDVTGVTLNKTAVTLNVNGTETLTATVAPDDDVDKTVIWSSDNTSVATVSNGVVTAVSKGTANITVTATNGTEDTSDDKTATCAVTVEPISYNVTYKVVNGTWDGTSTADKTETVASGRNPASVPTGMKAYSGYTGGSWDTDPSTATISADTTFTYTFVAKEAATVIKAPTANTFTYNGKPQELVTAGTAEGGEMQYALGTKDAATQPYTTSIPTATEAGTYYVWYKAVGNENYSDSKADVVTVTIKSSVTITFDSNGGSEVDPQVIDKGGKAEEPEEPTNGKLAFIGWFIDPTIENLYDLDNDKINSFDFSSPVEKDTELTAVWTAFARVNTIGTGKVNYAYEGEEKDDEYDDSIILSAIQGMADTFILTAKADEGSRFVKWQKVIEEGETVEDSTFEDYSEDEEITIKITEPISLVAVFETIDEDDKVYSSYESDTEWTKGSSKPLKICVKGSKDDDETINHFMGLKCNGKVIAEKYYTAKKGSVKIEINPEYLETLEVGKHVLTVMFDDADDVEITFTVLAAKEETSKDAKIDVDDKSKASNDASTDKATESKTDKVANTGDNAQPLLALFVMIDAALALNYVLLRKRRDKRN